jgi:osmotically-inducible protein OsmY
MKTFSATLLAAAIALSLGACATTTDKSGTRTMAQTIDDSTITGSVKSMLLADSRTQGFDINVDTARGVVTLNGGADSQAAKNAAGELARNAAGVVRVDNRLVVATDGTYRRQDANTETASGRVRDALSDTGETINDAWITSKVKSQFLADQDIKGLNITVETNDNVVTLGGVAQSSSNRQRAIDIARATQGVRSVQAGNLRVTP